MCLSKLSGKGLYIKGIDWVSVDFERGGDFLMRSYDARRKHRFSFSQLFFLFLIFFAWRKDGLKFEYSTGGEHLSYFAPYLVYVNCYCITHSSLFSFVLSVVRFLNGAAATFDFCLYYYFLHPSFTSKSII